MERREVVGAPQVLVFLGGTESEKGERDGEV